MKFIKKIAKQEFSRFILIGVANTAITYLIYIFLLQFISYLAAYSVCFAAGVLISYYLNSRFVFGVEINLKAALQYPLVYLAQYLFGCLALFVFVNKFAVDKAIAAILVAGLSVPLNFILSRLIIKPSKKFA